MTVTTGRYECDLHCHTTRSDGNDTPQELIDRARERGMKVVAITDHDVIPPSTIRTEGKEIDLIAYARKQGLILLPGCEYSTDTYVNDVHIIGYQLDWSADGVQQEMARAKRSKSEAYRELCQVLTNKGMPIDFEEEILRYTDSAGKEQIRSPEEVERKFIFEKMAEKGYAPTWGKAKIMVQSDSLLNVRRKKIAPLDTIDLIHQAGGLAVLAHPYLIDEEVEPAGSGKMSREEYIEKLIEHGLDGIEARYTYNKTSYKGNKTVEEIEREIKDKYSERLFISGGSDYHAGQKKGVINPREIGEAGISYQEFCKIFSINN